MISNFFGCKTVFSIVSNMQVLLDFRFLFALVGMSLLSEPSPLLSMFCISYSFGLIVVMKQTANLSVGIV